MSFSLYAVECLGARLSWIPFSNAFERMLKKQLESIREHETSDDKANDDDDDNDNDEDDHSQFYHIFDYESMIAKLGCITYQIEFKFSNESISKLAEYFVYLPSRTTTQQQEYEDHGSYGKQHNKAIAFGNEASFSASNHSTNGLLQSLIRYQNDEDYMIHVRLGPNCCRNVSLFAMAEMYRTGHTKIVCNTNELDWNRIVFNNTLIHEGNKIYLSVILTEFIRYGEIGPLNVLLQPSLRLGMNTSDVKKSILLASPDNGSNTSNDSESNSNRYKNASKIEIDPNEYLLLIKKYSDQNVLFYNCDEMAIIYEKIWKILTLGLLSDTAYFVITLLLLHYTQKNIKNHGCAKGCCKLKDYLLKLDEKNSQDSDDANNSNNKNNNNGGNISREKRDTIVEMIDSILNCYFYPKMLPIQYRGKSNEMDVQCNEKQRLYLSFELCEMFASHSRQLENWILLQCSQSAMKTTQINAVTQRIAMKEIDAKVKGNEEKEEKEEKDKEEEKEEKKDDEYIGDDEEEEDGDDEESDPFSRSMSNPHARIIIKSAPNEWFGDVSQMEIDFVEMIISCDAMKTGLPKNKKVLQYFNLLDKLLCHWKMNFSLFYLYTLSQLQYRLVETMKIESRILAPELSLELENTGRGARTSRSKPSTIMSRLRKKKNISQTISIPGEVILDNIVPNQEIWGLKRISFELEDLLVENLERESDVVIDINNRDEKNKSGKPLSRRSSVRPQLAPSNCELTLIVNLPILMKKSTVAKRKPLVKEQDKGIELDYSDKSVSIHWNPIEIATFELPMGNGTSGAGSSDSAVFEADKAEKSNQTFECDISDYRGLSLYNPNTYNLNEISFDIRLDCGSNRRVSCDNVKIEVEYFVKSLINNEDIEEDDGLLPYAVEKMNVGLIDYLIKRKSLFDINATRIEDGNNALHVCCMNKSVPMDILERLLNDGIDLNHRNKDGYTPIDILHTLRVKSSKIQDKEAVMKLMVNSGATYHLVDPKMELLIDKNFFEELVYPHSYIPASPLAIIDTKLDVAMHKLAYELLFLGRMDASTVNLFVIFDILLSLSQLERTQLCIKYNSHYDTSIVESIQDLFSSPKFSNDDHGTTIASQSMAITLGKMCVANEESDAQSMSSILLGNSKGDKKGSKRNKNKTKKLSVANIQEIINIVCPKTNYEIRQMKNVFFEKNNEKSASSTGGNNNETKRNGTRNERSRGRTRTPGRTLSARDNDSKENEESKDDSVKLARVVSEAIQDSLDIQQVVSDHTESINNLYGAQDRDKIVSMRALVNLLSLKRNEEVIEPKDKDDRKDGDDSDDGSGGVLDKNRKKKNVGDDVTAFDPAAVPFDMLMEYPQRSKMEYLLRDEFDEWFVFLVSECSWQYIWQFSKYFENAYFDFQVKLELLMNDANNNNNNNLQLGRKKKQGKKVLFADEVDDKNDEKNESNDGDRKMSFYAFAMTQLDLPPLMKELVRVTLNIAGCGNTSADKDISSSMQDRYHGYFGTQIAMKLKSDEESKSENKENILGENVKQAGGLIARRCEIDIFRINEMFKLDNILSSQASNNQVEAGLKYLLLKLVCANTKLLRNVLSDALVHARGSFASTINDKYRIYLPKIEDLRKFAKINNNPNRAIESSRPLNYIDDKYVNYPPLIRSSKEMEQLKTKLEQFWTNYIDPEFSGGCAADEWETKLGTINVKLTKDEMNQLYTEMDSHGTNNLDQEDFVDWMINDKYTDEQFHLKYQLAILDKIDGARVLLRRGGERRKSISVLDPVMSVAMSLSKHPIGARDLCSFNANIDEFLEFGLIMHGFENDKRNIIYDRDYDNIKLRSEKEQKQTKKKKKIKSFDTGVVQENEIKDNSDDSDSDSDGDSGSDSENDDEYQNQVTGFVFSQYNKSFYNNMIDNGTHGRYKSLMLIPFFKENFGRRNSKFSKFENENDIKNIVSRFWDRSIDVEGDGNVSTSDWLNVFKTMENADFTQIELRAMGNKLDVYNADVIEKVDFVDFVVGIITKESEEEEKNDEKKDDEQKELEWRFVEYIWKEARNPLNYRNKFVCRLMLNILTIEGLPFDKIEHDAKESKEETAYAAVANLFSNDDDNGVYCVSCSINNTNLKDDTKMSDIAVCYDKDDGDINKKMQFGYPIINKSYVFDSFQISNDSIDISLKFGKVSKNEMRINEMMQDPQRENIRNSHRRKVSTLRAFEKRVEKLYPDVSPDDVASISRRLMKTDYQIEYKRELLNATGKIKISDIIDNITKNTSENENENDENNIIVGSGKDFTIINSTKLFPNKNSRKKSQVIQLAWAEQPELANVLGDDLNSEDGEEREKETDKGINIVYCIQAQFLERTSYNVNDANVFGNQESEINNATSIDTSAVANKLNTFLALRPTAKELDKRGLLSLKEESNYNQKKELARALISQDLENRLHPKQRANRSDLVARGIVPENYFDDPVEAIRNKHQRKKSIDLELNRFLNSRPKYSELTQQGILSHVNVAPAIQSTAHDLDNLLRKRESLNELLSQRMGSGLLGDVAIDKATLSALAQNMDNEDDSDDSNHLQNMIAEALQDENNTVCIFCLMFVFFNDCILGILFFCFAFLFLVLCRNIDVKLHKK